MLMRLFKYPALFTTSQAEPGLRPPDGLRTTWWWVSSWECPDVLSALHLSLVQHVQLSEVHLDTGITYRSQICTGVRVAERPTQSSGFMVRYQKSQIHTKTHTDLRAHIHSHTPNISHFLGFSDIRHA